MTSSAEETMQFGREFAQTLRGGEVIALQGPLGSGKTTLTKGIAEGLGISPSEVRSPTFVLLRSYDGKTADGKAVTMHHLDAYRLEGAADFEDIGGTDLLGDDSICVVEWADRIQGGLPEHRIDIKLEHVSPTERKLELRGKGSGE